MAFLEHLIWETSTSFFDCMFIATGGWDCRSEEEDDLLLTYCAGGEL